MMLQIKRLLALATLVIWAFSPVLAQVQTPDKKLNQPQAKKLEHQKLVNVKVTEFINIKLPDNFQRMTDEELAAKYPSGRKPLAMYSTPNKLVDFGVNGTNNAWEEGDLTILRDFYRANIQELYDEVQFSYDAIDRINKKDFVVFEFSAGLGGGKKNATGISGGKLRRYYYLMYTIVKKQVFVINFNAPEGERMLWAPEVRKMMESIKVTR